MATELLCLTASFGGQVKPGFSSVILGGSFKLLVLVTKGSCHSVQDLLSSTLLSENVEIEIYICLLICVGVRLGL